MAFAAGEGIGIRPIHPRGPRPLWGLGASLVVHVLLGLALLLVATPPSLFTSQEDSITVDVVTPQEFDAAGEQPQAVTQALKSPNLPSTSLRETKSPEFTKLVTDRPAKLAAGMIRAKHLMAAAVLADPRSAKAAKAMKTLAASERIVQLCNVEAMEQIHAWNSALKPDFLVAYAIAETRQSGNRLQADGAAFRSKQHWYDVSFTCEARPDLAGVDQFAFQVGDEIPKDTWRDHNLAPDDGEAD